MGAPVHNYPYPRRKRHSRPPPAEISGYYGFVAVGCAIIGAFFTAQFFVPMAFVFSILAILTRHIAWGMTGLFFTLIVFMMSPDLISMTGFADAVHNHGTGVGGNYPGLEGEEQYEIRKDKAVQEMQDAIADCHAQRLNGKLSSYVESAECSNPKMIEAFQKAGYRHMDLINELADRRLELAKKLDKGEISENDAEIQDAAFLLHLHAEAEKRDEGKK